MIVCLTATKWVTDIHNKAQQGSLNNYATHWDVYDHMQPEDTKGHISMKTGHHGHVHALLDLRVGFNGWAAAQKSPDG